MSPRVRNWPVVCALEARRLFRYLRISKGPLVLACLALSLQSACASHELVELPVREADVYPYPETKYGIAVAIDEISEQGRIDRYFGTDLFQEGILPVEVILSNHGPHRVKIGPADVLLVRGREVIDPIPVEEVANRVKSKGLWTSDTTGKQIDQLFADLILKETIVGQGETVRGVMFFRAPETPAPWSRYFSVRSLFPQARLKLQLVITDLDGNERIRFDPFSLYTKTKS